MAEEDQASKTEDPTGKRLGDAKNRGQVAQSQEVKSWAILLAGTIGVATLAPGIMSDVATLGAKFVGAPHEFELSREAIRGIIAAVFQEMGLILWPFMLLLVVAALAVTVGQVGWNVSTEKFKLNWSAFSPVTGAKKIAGPKSVLNFVKGVLKIAVVGALSVWLITPVLMDIEILAQLDIVQILDRMDIIALRLTAGTVAAMTVIAMMDYVYQKHEHIKKLKMTKQEVKDETKQQEGDPKIKQRLAQIRMEKAQERMITAVPKADVVITNPTHYAVALKYDMDVMPAPKLVAKGVDAVAMRIREVADEHDVPIVENPPLARAIYAAVEIDEEIPAEHYKAVAEVISYVFGLKGKLPQAGPAVDQAETDQPPAGGL